MFQQVINPARFSDVVGQVRMYSASEVDGVLDQAHSTFRTWSRTTPQDRAFRLREAARDLWDILPRLTTLFVRENGKTMREAEVDIRRSIELMELVAADLPKWWKPEVLDAHQPVIARKRPRGVTAVISPWNSPVLLSFKRFIPAVATGNTVVLKPATHCPLTVMECVAHINQFLPAGVLNVVTGSGSEVGEKLATDERVRAIAFTGSTDTGRRIIEIASQTVKKMFLELGGNDPALVLDDAVLDDDAMTRMANAVLRAAGQVYIAIKRVYVHRSRFDELVDKLGKAFDRVIVGDGLAPQSTMGPLNNKTQFNFVSGIIHRSQQAGLAVLTKGSKLDPDNWQQGFFMLPAIVLGANEDHEVIKCEQFGPIVPIRSFENDSDALERANNSPYGLRASVWTAQKGRAQEFADRLEAGAVFWNNHGIFRDLHIEFPGIKQSGLSRESRWAALDHYVDTYGFAE